jgi:hypothetical protein
MDDLTFGLTMLLVGMGGTMLTLWLLTLVIDLLRWCFPPDSADREDKRP